MSVTLKLATSLDGRIATASGESRWITGEAAREQVHRLRAMHQAVVVGVETAIADDPELTVRLDGYVGAQPSRVVLDSRGRLPLTSRLVKDAERLDTVVVTTRPLPALAAYGVTVLQVPAVDGRCDLSASIEALRRRGQAHVMVEGGGQVAAGLLSAGLVDRIEWFRAPIVLGDEGRPAVGDFILQHLADAPRFRRVDVQVLGDDLWERYERLS